MGNYFKDLVNHPKRILKLSLVALVVLLIAGLAVGGVTWGLLRALLPYLARIAPQGQARENMNRLR